MNDFEKICSDYRVRFDKRLNNFLDEQTAHSDYSDNEFRYPSSLYDPLKYIMQGGGKRIRPLMVIFSCEAFGGSLEKSLDAAVAMEVLHNFTLVHDDIMDNADTRRGKQTIHRKWSVNEAILVGDELLGLSYRSLLKTESKRIDEIVKAFTDGVIEVCVGQALDKQFETENDVSLDDYEFMIGKKTAELLKTSAVIGSIIADAKDEQIQTIKNYSRLLGIAFQIQDDLLDVVANEQEFGKKIGGDILERKKTYLYLKALELTDDNVNRRLKEIYYDGFSDNGRIEEIIEIYNNSGAIDFARREIAGYIERANGFLQKIANAGARQRLENFSDMLLKRNY